MNILKKIILKLTNKRNGVINLETIEKERRKDWITIDIDHERYCFGTHLGLWKNMTLKEVVDSFYVYNYDRIEELEAGIRYQIDNSCHGELDTKYGYKNYDGNKLQHFHIGSLLIISADYFMKNECASFTWGQTENKFGLIDIKR